MNPPPDPKRPPKPKPSEWGKLRAGQVYIFWALDLARAVSAVGLGENVGMLFWYVAENSFISIRSKKRGEWPDPLPVAINYTELGEFFGVTKQRVYDAEKWLTKANMLHLSDAGYFVNKDAHTWVHPVSGAPLLAGKRLAYAVSARTRSDQSIPETPGNVTPLPNKECESDKVTLDRYESNVQPLPEPIHDNCQSNGVTLPATIGTGTALDSIQLNELRSEAATHATPILKPTPDGPHDPAMMQPYPGGIAEMDVVPGTYPMTEANARSIYARLWDAFGNMVVCRGFVSHQHAHSADTWRTAIRELVESGTVARTIRIIQLRAGDIEVRPKDRPSNGRHTPQEPALHRAPADSPHRNPKGA